MAITIWEGIYKDFQENLSVGKGFDGDTWINKLSKKLSKILDDSKKKKAIPEIVAYNDSLLPFLAAIIVQRSGNVSILDIGGGLGIAYLQVNSALARAEDVDYHIVEKKKVCETGRKIFQNDKRIHFHTSSPRNLETDIVHMGGVLCYIKDWKAYLYKLLNYKPEYFLFTNLNAGEIPAYATFQNYYGSKIPCWFFNIDDVTDTMKAMGFKLSFKSTYAGTYLGKEQDIPQDNFPEKYRLKNSCSILFARDRL